MSSKYFKTKILLLFIVLTTIFSVTGCSKNKDSAQKNIFRIGITAALNSPLGIETANWFKLFAKIINEKGGWTIGDKTYELDLIVYDHAFDPAKHRSSLNKLVFDDNVKFVLESLGAIPATSAEIAEENKVVILGIGYGDETAKPKYNYFFRAQGLHFIRGANYIMYSDWKDKGARSVLLVNPDNEGGHSNAKQFATVLPVVGIEKKGPVFFPADTTDFSMVAIKAKELKPDCIDLGAASDDQIVNFIRALKEVGYRGFIFPGLMNAKVLENLNRTVGKEYIEGFLSPYLSPKDRMKEDKEVKYYVDKYIDEYEEFGEDGAYWTAAWFVFKDAVETTQSTDPEVIKKYLESGPHAVKTLVGWAQLFARPDLRNNRTIDGSVTTGGVGIIRNGKLEFYKKTPIKTNYLMTIICTNTEQAYNEYWKNFGRPVFPNDAPSTIEFDDIIKRTEN